MTDYRAPLADMNFALTELAGLSSLAALPGCEDASEELVAAILEEGAKLAGEVISPLNVTGDQQGVQIDESEDLIEPEVKTAAGFKEAYRQFVDGGWGSLQFEPEYGGQSLPFTVAIAVQEMWHAANMSWGLCPLLSQGAIEAISANASDSLKEQYLPKMISGEWTGTMNLTEPQAGSDMAILRSKAEPHGDHYLISGQKIFITWGEHDMAENIVHLVLARLPDAPPGVKGISLFVVPKFLLNSDGSLGKRNDCRVVSVEHKIGIHASPTCVMSYGDRGGAVGFLVGEENRGLACMFSMMNNARLTVGLQGVSISERSYQLARDYAQERPQGIAPGQTELGPIIRHPDVRRMLLTMRALTEAARGLAYTACSYIDYRDRHPDADMRAFGAKRASLLTPIVKGWITEIAQEVTSIGVQVHGGMGFIEETGAAQHLRDARILPIYEGTNGIQALDLVGRKVLSDKGLAMDSLLEEMCALIAQAKAHHSELEQQAQAFEAAVQALTDAKSSLLLLAPEDEFLPGSISHHFLMLAGVVCGGWQMLKSGIHCSKKMQGASGGETEFYRVKQLVAAFYMDQILPRYLSHAAIIATGSRHLMTLGEEDF